MTDNAKRLARSLVNALRALLDLELKTGHRMDDSDRLELLEIADSLEDALTRVPPDQAEPDQVE
jgi:hypothetical protein